MIKRFRYLLLPFSLLYGCIIWIRNKLFDWNILKSSSFNFPVICVGNLSMGGTGKTPMVEYLIRLLKNKYAVATLSRGYKRKTSGFAIADDSTTALDIGDEPMQFHKKFKDITVAVAEERQVAIPQLLHARPETSVIILDDAFQHRQVKAGLNILLTECKHLYTRDFILPAGNLRDIKSSNKRADIIIITKCNPDLTDMEKNKVIEEINPASYQSIFFTTIEYGCPYHLFNKREKQLGRNINILLISGIADPGSLHEFLDDHIKNYESILFSDHHIFSVDDLRNIQKRFTEMESENKIILTTEKDGVRLIKFQNELETLPIFVLPFKHKFLFDEEDFYNEKVHDFVESIQTIN